MDEQPPSAIRPALATDLRQASWRRRALLLGVVAWLVYEWGPGNETVTPWLLARLLRDHEGWPAIVVTVSVGIAFTTVQQLLSGATALAGFALFERTAAAAWQRLTAHRGSPPPAWRSLGWAARAALAFGLGTTAVALVEVVGSGQAKAADHRRAVVASALLCGGIVGAIAGATSLLVVLGRQVSGLRGPTDRLLDVLGSPWTWLGLLVVLAIVRRVRNRTTARTSDPITPDRVGQVRGS